MGFIINILWTLVILGFIIFFHELGHFLAAKKLGIVVERFSIGFGPKMIGIVKGGTEYRISWLPFLGGYVKMLGENPGERPDGETDEEEAIPEEGRFDLAPAWHRAIVAVSGPAMNIVLAIFMFSAAFMFGLPAEPDSTITYVAPDSPASKAGIEPGDKIVSIEGYKVRIWNDIVENVVTRPGDELSITLLRNGSERTVHAAPEQRKDLVGSISLDLQNELDNKIISIDLRQELRINKLLLFNENSRYIIKKENNGLGVYRETATGDMELALNIALDIRDESVIQSDLNNSIIPESLVSKFDAVDMKLSQRATVTVEEADNKWLITDKAYGKGILRWLIPGKEKRYHVRRQNGELRIYFETGFGMLGVGHSDKAIIRKLEPDSTVAKAGLRLGDSIEAVNGNKISYDDEFERQLGIDAVVSVEEAGSRWLITGVSVESITLTVGRDGGTTEIPVPLEYDEHGQLVSFKGLSFNAVVRMNPAAAFIKAVPETMRMGRKIFQFLKKMIFGEVSTKFIAGPLGIVQIAMIMVQTGFATTLQFVGFLSVNLGVVNLLPLFITDGAMLVFLAFEGLRRKPLAYKKQLIIQQVGISFILLLFLLVTYNDIVRLVMGI